jgi:hypothetical protein
MYYEVNLSFKGNHLFATAPRSIQTEAQLKEVLTQLRGRFPKEEGWQFEATFYPERGTIIDIEDLLQYEKPQPRTAHLKNMFPQPGE